jgi:anaerobic magnesium-protoporphyrin IX monomethyl ester cyclase
LRYDYFGITATTSVANNANRLSKLIKYYHPQSKIVFGGVHVTALPEEPFARGCADFVIRGDGEDSLVQLIKGETYRKINGLSYLNNGRVDHVRPDGYINDLDLLPFLAYDKIDFKRYRPAAGSYRRLPAINMNTSRGCPGKCSFCNSANIPLRRKSAERIFHEIRILRNQYGVKEIAFYDDTFTVYPATVMELCGLFLKHKMRMSWSCFARADAINFQMLRAMKKAGCHQVMYGVESGSRQVLENINKNIDLDKTESAIGMTRKAGITTRCAFMIGNQGDSIESIHRTIQYAIKLAPDIAVFNIATPYPGTGMYAWAKKNNLLVTENWDDYDLGTPVMALPGLEGKEVKRKYQDAYRLFYFRPRYIAHKLFSRDLWRLSSFIKATGLLRDFLAAANTR